MFFLDWMHSLESYFRCYSMNNSQQLYFVEAKMKGMAHVWWIKKQSSLRRHGTSDVRTWEEMKLAMTCYFLPPDYKQRILCKFIQLKQDNMTIDEYTSRII